ncbi:MAG: hypothetical protein WBN04_10095 [Paracoccaceae bacterium]
MSHTAKRNLILLLICVAVIWGLRWSALRAHHLSFVPPAMKVSRVLYVAEEAWGFGPGGNETGIIVYRMPDAARQRIEADGLDWLNGPSGGGPEWHGHYRNWHETPFNPDVPGAFDIWALKRRAESCDHGGGIAGYMFRYGFCIPFDSDVEKLANIALVAPGSYYAFGRIGMLLLIPSENRIIYAYNG